MSQLDMATVVIGAAGFVLNVVVFVVIALQLQALRSQVADGRTSTLLDHDRRKKQATLEFYAMTLESRLSIPKGLPFDRDELAVKKYIARLGQRDSPKVRSLHNYLSLFHLLAVGVNTEVFDLAVVDRMAGSRIRAMARNYEPWIVERRRAQNAPNLFGELFVLAENLEQLLASRESAAKERQV